MSNTVTDDVGGFVDDERFESGQGVRGDSRYVLATGRSGISAELVMDGDEISAVAIKLTADEGGPSELDDELVAALMAEARERGYELTVLGRRLPEGDPSRVVLDVRLDRDPAYGDGRGVGIEVELGVDVEPDESPELAEAFLAVWLATVEDLVAGTYPRARLSVVKADDDSDEVKVAVPPGLDSTELEWKIDELIEQASEEAAEKVGGSPR